MCIIINEMVLTQPFWREKANLPFLLAIAAKFPGDLAVEKVELTNDEHEVLEKGMKVDGQINPAINIYYAQCLNAVYLAEAKVVLTA